jgi:hypothetical protein
LVLAVLVGFTAALVAAGCGSSPEQAPVKPEEPTGPHATLLKLFPKAGTVPGWKPQGPVKVYGPTLNMTDAVEPLVGDLPNDAALFQGYNYRKSGTARYAGAQPTDAVTLRVFDMESPSEAFGIFSVLAKGREFQGVGLAARMDHNSLKFVKGNYYIWIDFGGTGDAEPTLKDFAGSVAGEIKSPGYRPSILSSFPKGAVEGEMYYLHTFETLVTLPFVPKADREMMKQRLALTPQTDVVIVGYPTDKPTVLNDVFTIRYGSPAEAESAYYMYSQYLETSNDPKEKNTTVAQKGQFLVGTFNAEENSVHDRLRELLPELAGPQ